MIEVRNLSKRYGEKAAVDSISFTVEEGEVLGFLGPNGAGKSTTMNMLTGYISSSSGQALINGIDILEDPSAAKSQIGYLPEIPPLYPDMTVKEYLNFVYDLKRCKLPRNEHLQQICALVKISDVYGRVIKHLSKGYKQRVGLAQAMVGNPPVLILDEPTAGLDPKQIIEIRSLIKRLGQKHTVILSSHILPEIQATCDKIVIINRGQIVANDTAENLSQNITDDHKIVAKIEGPSEELIKLIRGIKGVISVECGPELQNMIHEYTVDSVEGTDIRRTLFQRLAERNWPLLALKSSEMTLEDIFLKITMGESAIDSEKLGRVASDNSQRPMVAGVMTPRSEQEEVVEYEEEEEVWTASGELPVPQMYNDENDTEKGGKA